MRFSILVFIFVVAATTLSASAKESDLSPELKAFKEALVALKANKKTTFSRLKKSLKNDPLYPYLEYEELSRSLGNSRSIRSFLKTHANTPLAERLRRSWLRSLAKRKQWSEYYKAYDSELDGNTELRCHYMHASLRKGKNVFKAVQEIYPVGKSLPDACDPVFDHYYKSGAITPAMIWDRLVLAGDKRNSTLARYLAKRLPKAQQGWYTWWQNLNARPLKTMRRLAKEKDSDYLRDMLAFGLVHYARDDTTAAWDLWHSQYKNKFKFTRDQINKVEHAIALRAAWRHMPEAYGYLTSLAEAALDQEAREWRVRSALRIQNWSGAISQIKALPEKSQTKAEWRYWLARAYEMNQTPELANELYRELASETDYYGFLSAEKIGTPYIFNHVPVLSVEEESKVASLANEDGFVRARLLSDLGRDLDVTREWNFAIKSMSKDEIRVASRLAQQWGWNFTAIATIAKARHFEDLQLRFPVKYNTLVESEAQRNRIDSSWVYGVIRRESAWREDVVSPAGAVGLMQLMPATAKSVAKKVGMKRPSRAQLTEVPRNIRLGTAYLREVLDQYDDNEILATASYNAGPHRVKAWLPELTTLPSDVWVDTIPFDETRAYVKAVQAYSMIMAWKTGKPERRLDLRMPPVYTIEEWEEKRAG